MTAAGPVRVAIVDDHEMMLEGLVALLSLDDRLQVIGTSVTLAAMHDQIEQWNPDVLVADYQLPDGVIVDSIASVRTSNPACAILVVSGLATPPVLEAVAAAGGDGVVGKGLGTSQLCDAIMTVANGGVVFPAKVIHKLANQDLTRPGATLTERERDVLRLLVVPYSAEDIARQLELSMHTVRNHIRSILTKLNASSQLEAVLIALRHGVVELSA